MATRVVSSLEVPVVLVADGLGATEAVLEELDPRGDCRMRSLRFFSRGTRVTFRLGTPGDEEYVRGRIAGYETRGQRFIYHVALDALNGSAEGVAWTIGERRRRLAAGHPVEPVADATQRPPLARAKVRTRADFEVQYRVGESWAQGTAANLSTGGLLMRARETLVEGMAVELRFRLPSDVLDRCCDDALLGKLWDPAVRQAAQAMLRRPFKELVLRARVVCHRTIAGNIADYGLEFVDLDTIATNEIERYCTAASFANSLG